MEVMLTLFLSGFEVGNNIILSIESLFMLFRIIQSFYISIALIIIALAGTQFWGICIKHSSSDEELGPGQEIMLSNNCKQQIEVLYLISVFHPPENTLLYAKNSPLYKQLSTTQ
jgi:hypothetical protein